MTSSENAADERLGLAAHLIRCGLGNSSPARDAQYGQAVALWPTSPAFRGQVRAIAGGMGLVVADVNNFGIALATLDDTLFAPSPGRIHNYYQNGSAAKDRVTTATEAKAILAAVLAVIACVAYPDEQALEGTGTPGGAIYAKEIRERLELMACNAERLDASRPGDDGTDGKNAGLQDGTADGMLNPDSEELIWQAIRRCPSVRTTKQGRLAEGNLAWHVGKAFELLDRNGHAELRKPSGEDEEGGTYILPRDRFRKLVLHHSASAAFASIRAAMAAEAGPPAQDLQDPTAMNAEEA